MDILISSQSAEHLSWFLVGAFTDHSVFIKSMANNKATKSLWKWGNLLLLGLLGTPSLLPMAGSYDIATRG